MERKFLEGLGLEKDVIDKVLDQNGAEVAAVKTQLTTKDTEIKTLRSDLITANARVSELEKVDVDDLMTQLQAEKDARNKEKKEFTLRTLLNQEGCTDVDYLLYKLGDSVEFDDDGNIKDSENFVKSTKENYASQFQSESGSGGTGGTGNFKREHGGNVDTSKMTYSELAAYMAEHPEAKID